MYLILEGSVRTFGTNENNGEEIGYAVLLPGDVFGQTAMLDPAPRSMTVRANEDLTFVAFSRADFERLRSLYPRIAARVYRNLARILGHNLALTYQKYKHRFFWSPP
jgi:CRP-like cAMP-binding protein